MSELSLDEDSGMCFACPRCGAQATDELETIDAYAPVDWRCVRCERVFSVLLLDCVHCAGETVVVALDGKEQPRPEDVVCVECGERCVDHGEAVSDL